MNKVILLAALVSVNGYAWDCDHSKQVDTLLDLSDSEELSVFARAGDLEIVGKPGSSGARIIGEICVSEEDWLDEADVITTAGRSASIEVRLPDTDGRSSGWGNRYAYIDLRVEVPDTLPLKVKDSSGDIKIESTGSIDLYDSSGGIDIEDINGDVVINDSSGDIDLLAIAGNVTVERDSSGDIYGRDIEGSVTVERDSSGDIRFRDVRYDFVVERDSSGDIEAESVGGNFTVMVDGSGDIDSRGVSGTVSIPDKG